MKPTKTLMKKMRKRYKQLKEEQKQNRPELALSMNMELNQLKYDIDQNAINYQTLHLVEQGKLK